MCNISPNSLHCIPKKTKSIINFNLWKSTKFYSGVFEYNLGGMRAIIPASCKLFCLEALKLHNVVFTNILVYLLCDNSLIFLDMLHNTDFSINLKSEC